VFDANNSDIVFAENLGADITANIITDSGAVSGEVYTGDQVASFLEQALEGTSGLSYTYTVSYDETTNLFTIANDAGNGGTLNLRWGVAGTTAEQTLGFNNVDSGAFAAGISDAGDNQVEFNVLNNVNDKFRLTIDGTASAADIVITAGAYTSNGAGGSSNLADEIALQINADANHAGITVDFGGTITGQFTIASSTTGTSSTVTLTSDASDDFLVTAGLNRDFEVSGTSSTPLADLNGGTGVTAGNLTITDRAGNGPVNVAVLANQTIADVVTNINSAAVNVTAQLNSAGNGIDIIDNNGFPTQNLVVADNATARDLGIVGNKPGVIYGADLNPSLSNATRVNVLDGGNGLTLSAVRVVNGLQNENADLSRANSITDILTALNGLGINTAAAINSAKTAIDVSSTSSQTAAIVSEVDGGTTSSDLGIQGANDFLKTMAVLEEALQKDDRNALLNMLDQFDLVLERLVEKGSGVGARTNQIDSMKNITEAREVEIIDLKSDIEDADMVEYLTKFTMQQTALQAMMSVAGRAVQLSLLDFLR
jgi:flagellin-like hook-associated protein FlgL